MKRGKVNYWTKEEDDAIIHYMKTVNNSFSLATFLKKHNKVSPTRSHASIYQRIFYVRWMVEKKETISYKPKLGRPVGSTNVKREKPTHVVAAETVKEVTLPKGMTLDFTGKRITITDTYIKIYI